MPEHNRFTFAGSLRSFIAKHSRLTLTDYQVPRSPAVVYAFSERSISVFPLSRQIAPKRSHSVSLIVTCRNEENTIHAWLDSLVKLEQLPLEVVICDGGSTDRTVQIVDSWRMEGERNRRFPANFSVQLICRPGLNIAQGRNVAAKAARGEILLFSDLGCELDPKWISFLATPFVDDVEVQYVMGWYEIRSQSTLAEIVVSTLTSPLSQIDPELFLPSARSFGIRRELFESLKGYPEYLTKAGEDTLFDYRLKETGVKGAFVPDALVTWHFPAGAVEIFCKIFGYSRGDGEAGILFLNHYRRIVGALSDLVGESVFFVCVGILTLNGRFGDLGIVATLGLFYTLSNAGRNLFAPLFNHLRTRYPLCRLRVVQASVLIVLAQGFGFATGRLARRHATDS